MCLNNGEPMAGKRIVYPRSLKEIPLWRRRQITEDILWFSKYTPSERLDYIDREWVDVQEFIRDFSLKKYGTRKRS
jgi:hypothetical protein